MTNNKQHISYCISSLIDSLPEEEKKKILTEKRIKKIQNQYAEIVDDFILEHTNSVYLLHSGEDKTGTHYKKLVTYVDNSTIAAELNARRELIKFKYSELFNEHISSFEIRISKGHYREKYPFKEMLKNKETEEAVSLTEEELQSIEDQVSSISNQELRESFKKVLIAKKLNFKKR